eukprot:TRINITY_DN6540_c0_g1_i4.p1 TRINITY_DN6540_c0_g1~~TRINITY_DN6540_c0_g1_i4.p1  ORF type:complete len:603 (-),score=52.37 TRINITY_DN6540_c0_g1_i4:945-2753(-)
MKLVVRKVDDGSLGSLNAASRMLHNIVKESVERLQFKQCDFMESDMRRRMITTVMDKYSGVCKVLDLSNIAADLTNDLLAHLLNQRMEVCHQELQELHLRGCHRLLGSDIVSWATLNLTSLTLLDVSGCWLLNHDGFESLLDAQVLPKSLICRNSYIEKETLQMIVVKNTNLVELDISYPRRLEGNDLKVLEGTKKLCVLRIQHDKQVFLPLQLSFLTRLQTLRVLDLPKVVFKEAGYQLEYMQLVQDIMLHLTCLEELSLMEVFSGLQGSSFSPYLRKFTAAGEYSNLAKDVFQGRGQFQELVSLQIAPAGDTGRIENLAQLPSLTELKFHSYYVNQLRWGFLASFIVAAPKLRMMGIQSCELTEWDQGLGYDAHFQAVEELQFVNCALSDENFQRLYSMFPGLRRLKLQDLELPNSFLDNMSDKLESLELYFVRNVNQLRIISMRGCQPRIVHSYRECDLATNFRIARDLEGLIVRQQGRVMNTQEFKQFVENNHVWAKDDFYTYGLVRNLGADAIVQVQSQVQENNRSRVQIQWKIGGQIIQTTPPTKQTPWQRYSLDPSLSKVERDMLYKRRGHIRMLKGLVNHPREHLEYQCKYHNI